MNQIIYIFLQGTTTIRAYDLQRNFIQKANDMVDTNQICYFPSIISNRYTFKILRDKLNCGVGLVNCFFCEFPKLA